MKGQFYQAMGKGLSLAHLVQDLDLEEKANSIWKSEKNCYYL